MCTERNLTQLSCNVQHSGNGSICAIHMKRQRARRYGPLSLINRRHTNAHAKRACKSLAPFCSNTSRPHIINNNSSARMQGFYINNEHSAERGGFQWSRAARALLGLERIICVLVTPRFYRHRVKCASTTIVYMYMLNACVVSDCIRICATSKAHAWSSSPAGGRHQCHSAICVYMACACVFPSASSSTGSRAHLRSGSLMLCFDYYT